MPLPLQPSRPGITTCSWNSGGLLINRSVFLNILCRSEKYGMTLKVSSVPNISAECWGGADAAPCPGTEHGEARQQVYIFSKVTQSQESLHSLSWRFRHAVSFNCSPMVKQIQQKLSPGFTILVTFPNKKQIIHITRPSETISATLCLWRTRKTKSGTHTYKTCWNTRGCVGSLAFGSWGCFV